MTNSPCPKCGKRPRQDCGYLRKIPCTSGGGTDFDCVAPDVNGQPCDDCHHVWCDGCKAAAKSWWARFKEWWIKYTDPEPPEPPKPPLTDTEKVAKSLKKVASAVKTAGWCVFWGLVPHGCAHEHPIVSLVSK
jgi:hypothetical protein